MVFLQLFATFFLIGVFTFGGGYAMLSLIQAQVVTVHAWISEETFTNIVAISQMTPGPVGINCATYVGYEVGGVAGSLIATLALVLPSFIIVVLLARSYMRMKDSAMFKGMMGGIRPAVVGLIGAAALILVFRTSWENGVLQMSVIESTFPDAWSWVILAASFIAAMWGKMNPILLIILSGIAGCIIYW